MRTLLACTILLVGVTLEALAGRPNVVLVISDDHAELLHFERGFDFNPASIDADFETLRQLLR